MFYLKTYGLYLILIQSRCTTTNHVFVRLGYYCPVSIPFWKCVMMLVHQSIVTKMFAAVCEYYVAGFGKREQVSQLIL